MHRLTARLLLILMLAGTFTPLALAIATPAPHACCMRKPMHEHGSRDWELNASAGCCNHDCCRPLTVSQWAHLRPSASVPAYLPASQRQTAGSPAVVPDHSCGSCSGRGPPQFSIA